MPSVWPIAVNEWPAPIGFTLHAVARGARRRRHEVRRRSRAGRCRPGGRWSSRPSWSTSSCAHSDLDGCPSQGLTWTTVQLSDGAVSTRMAIEDRRSQLVDAALEVASQHGIAATTVRRVAEQAGVALGVVHYCFEDKDELFAALATRIVDSLVLAGTAGLHVDEQRQTWSRRCARPSRGCGSRSRPPPVSSCSPTRSPPTRCATSRCGRWPSTSTRCHRPRPRRC